MLRASLLVFACLLILAISPSRAHAQTGRPKSHAINSVSSVPLNINKFMVWANNSGSTGGHPDPPASAPARGSGTYPLRSTTILYTSSLLWGGYVSDGTTGREIRVNGGMYNSGLRPGAILSRGVAQIPGDPAVRAYRFRADYATAGLRSDAADLLMKPADQVTDAEVAQVRSQYVKDWEEWPWRLGAPFYDLNGNSVRDAGEDPGLAGADQIIWYAINDLDPVASSMLFGAAPTGMEIQTTIWAYKESQHVLANTVFERCRLIYKGTTWSRQDSRIDSMYVARFVDIDLGDLDDDVVGSDSSLQMGYNYNWLSRDSVFYEHGIPVPPAAGYTLLQGPVAAGTETDSAFFDSRFLHGRRNVAASSMIPQVVGSATFVVPFTSDGGLRTYNWMQGFMPLSERRFPFENPGGTPTRWAYSGDPRGPTGPVDRQGFYASSPGLDRRFLLSSGPFTMALGDTQEVVFALVGADGSDRLENTYYLKWFTKYLQQYYPDLTGLRTFAETLPAKESTTPLEFRLEQNYPNPFNASTTIEYTVAGVGIQASGFSRVKLAVYDMLGREVAVLVNKQQAPGRYAVRFDASGLPSGVSFYRMQAGAYVQTRKLSILR